ncbi:MAG: thioredoxin [Proteobacteria bacterium]|nr:thioredoxin [Pseudomonadota bacterium]
MTDSTALAAADLIKDGADATFGQDVVEESKRQPVIVDFWATWCGPCRQLGPALERQVQAAKGAVKLVKIDIDKHPRVAGQLGVQSIPTVYAFVDGQPVDGFMGALPESQLKTFIERLGAGGPPGEEGGSEIDQLLSIAAESVAVGDVGGAAQAFAQVLQLDPGNVKALAGLARVYLTGGDVDQARQIAAMAPADSTDPDLVSLRAALELSRGEPSETQGLEQKLKADPSDHATRFELANALAGEGDFDGAVDHLLEIVRQDREWNDQAARKQLLTVFEAAGPASETAKSGRRRLSSLLFA